MWFIVLFLLVIDWIMRKTLEGDNTGIGWKLWSRLNDSVDFADDTAFISSTKQQIQQKVRSLGANSKATGFKINSEKTKLLRLNTTKNEKVQVDDRHIDDVESFMYLGAHVISSDGTEDDIKARLGKAGKGCLQQTGKGLEEQSVYYQEQDQNL